MRRLGIAVALTILLIAHQAAAKGDFFEVTMTGPGLFRPVAFRFRPMTLGEETAAPEQLGGPAYTMAASLGFNSNARLIPMGVWTYHSADGTRAAYIHQRWGSGYDEWLRAAPNAVALFDAEIIKAIGGPIPPTRTEDAGAGRAALAASIIGALVCSAFVLARRGSFRSARRPARAAHA